MEKRERETEQGMAVVVRKVVHASPERVFDAWTKPEIMQHWYVGAKGVSRPAVDLRVGGAYSNEMIIEGCTDGEVGQKSYLHTGTYLEIVRPERLVFTWNSPAVQNTTVTVELREVDGGTEVTITHQLNSQEEFDSHRQGWTFALDGLGSLLG